VAASLGIGGGGRGRHRAFAEINVTPMVDVMLVLLIVFMVTAPLLSSALPIELPDVAAPTSVLDAETVEPLAVDIDAGGKVYVDETPVEGGSSAVEAAIAERIGDEQSVEQRPLHLRADRNADYGTVADVIAAARRAGVRGVNLVVEASQDDVARQ